MIDINKAKIEFKNYINLLIDRFNYKNPETKSKMEDIRNVLNGYIAKRLNNY